MRPPSEGNSVEVIPDAWIRLLPMSYPVNGQYLSSTSGSVVPASSGSCSLAEALDFALPREPGRFLGSSFSSF